MLEMLNLRGFISERPNKSLLRTPVASAVDGLSPSVGVAELVVRQNILTQMNTPDGGGELKSLYSGGDGSSLEQAVVIHCDRGLAGVRAEHAFVEQLCGQRGVDWVPMGQKLRVQDGRHYDALLIALRDGTQRTFYFAIDNFMGRG